MYDLIIIGAGAAGMTAGIYAKRANLNLLIIEKSAPGGQMVTTGDIENYPGVGKMTGPELSMAMYNHADSLGVPFEFQEVVEVKAKGKVKVVVLEDGTELETKSILITTGAVPRTLGVPNEDKFTGRGISWCAICDGAFYKDKKVVFVGGGNSAVDEALHMTGVASEVEVIQNLSHLTADSQTAERLLNCKNVKVHFNSQVVEFIGDEVLEGVKVVDNEGKESIIKTDGVFEYIGLKPSTSIVKNFDLFDNWGYITVNERLETKEQGIFAAGDVISKSIRQIVTATSDGAVAVQSILKYLESWK
ncbi:MAG: NAD(P)/FAD-dependent oxidoreductase [Acholeplasmataceae bacterium]|jgi:thioredoxin reductase (NADPH)